MQLFEKGHQLVLNQIHRATNINHLKKTKQTKLRSTLWKCRMKGAQFGWSILWLCLHGLQKENIPVAEALIRDGQKRQWNLYEWGSLVQCSHILGAICRLSFFGRRKLNCSTSTGRNREENNRACLDVIIIII